ncbi:MAG: glutamate-1-semialdehyde 2,1-aminomutase [Gemmatimonadales bacterium]
MNSPSLASRSRSVLPGGVNSPVRAFRSVGGDPLFVHSADGAFLTTTEGDRLADYVMSWGAILLGHNHPAVTERINRAVDKGVAYGMTCEAEIELAELIVNLVPSIEMVRFVNSGTEATMSAVRLARAVTERDMIVKMDGGYHGHGDCFLVSGGSGMATLGIPGSPGVPVELARLTLTAAFNDTAGIERLFDRHGKDIAAVIVEPFLGNAGFIPPHKGFLERLRSISNEHGALLIFDEVMTGFRVGLHGAQSLLGIEPDLTTLGKVIGGGFPVGAYGGRKDLMERVAPAGSVYQAGTLSGGPVAMAAGAAVLEAAKEDDLYDRLDRRSGALAAGLESAAARHGVPLCAAHEGGMWGFFFNEGPVDNFAVAKRSDTDLFVRFQRAMRELGVLLAPSPFEAAFVSDAHTDDIIADTIELFAQALAQTAV